MTTVKIYESMTIAQVRERASAENCKKQEMGEMALALGVCRNKTEVKTTTLPALRGLILVKLDEMEREHDARVKAQNASTMPAPADPADMEHEQAEQQPQHAASPLAPPVLPKLDDEPDQQIPASELAWAKTEISAMRPGLPQLLVWARDRGDRVTVDAIEMVLREFRVATLDTIAARSKVEGSEMRNAWLRIVDAFSQRTITLKDASHVANDDGEPRLPRSVNGEKRFPSGARTAAEAHRAQMRRRKKNQRKHRKALSRRRHRGNGAV